MEVVLFTMFPSCLFHALNDNHFPNNNSSAAECSQMFCLNLNDVLFYQSLFDCLTKKRKDENSFRILMHFPFCSGVNLRMESLETFCF